MTSKSVSASNSWTENKGEINTVKINTNVAFNKHSVDVTAGPNRILRTKTKTTAKTKTIAGEAICRREGVLCALLAGSHAFVFVFDHVFETKKTLAAVNVPAKPCLLYTSPSPRD